MLELYRDALKRASERDDEGGKMLKKETSIPIPYFAYTRTINEVFFSVLWKEKQGHYFSMSKDAQTKHFSMNVQTRNHIYDIQQLMKNLNVIVKL